MIRLLVQVRRGYPNLLLLENDRVKSAYLGVKKPWVLHKSELWNKNWLENAWISKNPI